MNINYKLLRILIKVRKYFKYIKVVKPNALDALQQKACDLFVNYVKDKDSELLCSIKTSKRHIKNSDVLILLYNSANGYIVTVIDESRGHNIYDIDLPSDHGFNLCNMFDVEMERKLRASEYDKRNIIVTDLDQLLKVHDDKLSQ